MLPTLDWAWSYSDADYWGTIKLFQRAEDDPKRPRCAVDGMDPFSVFVSATGLLGACAGIAKTLNDCRGKYSRADSTVISIAAECTIVSATLSRIGQIAKEDPAGLASRLKTNNSLEDNQLDANLQGALECCDLTLTALGDTLQKCSVKRPGDLLTWKGKVKYLWNEQELQDRLQMLRHLSQAMAGLLAAIQV